MIRQLAVLILTHFMLLQPAAFAAIVGGGGVDLKEEGVSQGTVTSVDCVGNDVTCSEASGAGTITVDIGIAQPNYYVAGHTYPGELENIYENPREHDGPCKLGSNCLSFDGADDEVDLGTTTLTTYCTASLCLAEAWVKPTGTAPTGANAAALDIIITSQTNFGLVRGNPNSEGDKLWVYNGDGSEDRVGVSYVVDKWNYIYGWHTAGVLCVYVNGVFGGCTISGDTATMTGQVQIGETAGGSSDFEGEIDEVAMWQKVGTIDDAKTRWNLGWGLELGGSETSLTGCWHFNEGTGSTADNCEGTAARDGTITGATWTANEGWQANGCTPSMGGCIRFNGTDNWIIWDYEDAFDFADGDDFTWDDRIYITDTMPATDFRRLVTKEDSAGVLANFHIDIPNADDDIRFYYRNSTDNGYGIWTSTNASLNANTWYHIQISYTFGTASSFVARIKPDGGSITNLTGSWTCSGTCPTGAGEDAPFVSDFPMVLGKAASGGGSHWLGLRDEVRIWKRILTQTEWDTITNIECDSIVDTTNLLGCWSFNETASTLAANSAPVANIVGLGDDTNNCTATGTPCRTLAAARNLISKFYSTASGSTITLHWASGIYPEYNEFKGYHPNGDYNLILQSYFNVDANSFTDAAAKSGTSTGSNTNGFPKNEGSLFNDTGASFVAADDDKQFLEITGPAGASGFCEGSGFNRKNWYRINTVVSSTQLSMVTKWADCGMPDNTITYKIYDKKHMGRIYGENVRLDGLDIRDSTGIILRKFAINKHIAFSLHLIDSSVEEISVISSNDNSGKSGYGAFSNSSFVDMVAASDFSDNYFAGFGTQRTHFHRFLGNTLCNNANDYGMNLVYSGSSSGITYNLFCDNPILGGLSFELGGHMFQLGFNRFDGNNNGLVVVNGAGVNIQFGNTFDNNTWGILVGEYGVVSVSAAIDGTPAGGDLEITNNTIGIYIRGSGQCLGCGGATLSGNTSDYNSEITLVNGNNYSIDQRESRFMDIVGPTAAFNVNTIDAARDGSRLTIINRVGQNMTIRHQDSGGGGTGKLITTNTGANITSTGNGMAELVYSYLAGQWVVTSFEP